MGGVSVNSLCQQGGLFALSVNRHSVNLITHTHTKKTVFLIIAVLESLAMPLLHKLTMVVLSFRSYKFKRRRHETEKTH